MTQLILLALLIANGWAWAHSFTVTEAAGFQAHETSAGVLSIWTGAVQLMRGSVKLDYDGFVTDELDFVAQFRPGPTLWREVSPPQPPDWQTVYETDVSDPPFGTLHAAGLHFTVLTASGGPRQGRPTHVIFIFPLSAVLRFLLTGLPVW
jgi:hypothetical protein